MEGGDWMRVKVTRSTYDMLEKSSMTRRFTKEAEGLYQRTGEIEVSEWAVVELKGRGARLDSPESIEEVIRRVILGERREVS
jgi:hypothetical protein